MRRSAKILAIACALALVAAGCGSDDDDDTSEGATATTTAGGTTAPKGDGAFEASEPLKLVGFWEIQGESQVGVNDFENAVQMALEAVNDAGGVGGKPVEYERVANPVLDPQQAVAAYLKALDANPSMIIGGGGSTDAIAGEVATGNVPLVSPDVNANVEFGTDQGSDYMWLFSDDQPSIWVEAERFLVDELGLTKLGFMGYTIPFGSIARDAVNGAADELGAEIVADREMELGGTDLTPQVLAMKDAGAEAVLGASYPNDNALQLQQFAQNDYDVPSIFQGGLTLAAAGGGVEGSLLGNSYAVADCNTFSEDPAMVEFRDAYKAKYDAEPSYLSAMTWDMVHYAAAVANQAQSTDPQELNDAIPDTTFTEGICNDEYHADGAHVIPHDVHILKFATDGTWSEVKAFKIEDKDKVGG